MTLNELRYALATAQEKHFGRAAARCHVSQPTLSVAIKKLEKRLGVALFERNKNEVHITQVGAKVLAQAQRVLEEAEKVTQIATSSQSQLTEPLKVGAIYTAAPYVFPLLIPQLNKIAPDMPLSIQENFTQQLGHGIMNGQLDAAIIARPFELKGVVVKDLYKESFVVLMPKNHRLAEKSALSASDLTDENTLMLGEGHCFRDHIIHSCPQCYNPTQLQQTVSGTSLETIRHMVASGLGITLLPCTATQIKYYSRTLCVRPFKSKTPRRTIALAWRNSFPRPKAIEALIQSLQRSSISNICYIN